MPVHRKGKKPMKKKPVAKMKKTGRKPAMHPGAAATAIISGGALGLMLGHRKWVEGAEKADRKGRKMTKSEEAAGKKMVSKNIAARRKKDISRLSKMSLKDPSKGYGERAYKIADNLRKSRKKKK